MVQKNLTVGEPAITNYLDDFLFIALSMMVCNGMMSEFLCLCWDIGCPISEEKMEGAASIMVFLGTLMNGRLQVISILLDKVKKAVDLIQTAISNQKVKIKFVQQLTGTLNFLSHAIVPGRTFTRGMYHKLKLHDKSGRLLRDHHHTYLDSQFINDCKVWLGFLMSAYERPGSLCRPFSDFDDSVVWTTLNLYSDSSLNKKLGYGGIFDDQWFFGQWSEKFIEVNDPSIEFLELFALVVSLTIWVDDPRLQNTRIKIFCDNQAVMHMVNNLTSSCMQCMKLLRILALQGIRNGRRVKVAFSKSKNNVLADALSRLDFARFWHNAPKTMHPTPCEMRVMLWPIEKIWSNSFNILNF